VIALPKPSDILIRVTTPWCCAGFVVRDGRVYCTARHNRYDWEVITS